MIKMRLSSPALADRGARLAGAGFTERLVPRQVGASDYEFPTACPPPHADRAAPDAPPPASGAVPFETCPAVPAAGRECAPAVVAPSAGALSNSAPRFNGSTEDETAPISPALPDAGAVTLSDHQIILLHFVAADMRCGLMRALDDLLIHYVNSHGGAHLARVLLDHMQQRCTDRYRGGGP
ncbi:hypothetical protein [Mesorhizobium sp. B2-3-4]|uniref:hypothetical protein n=1 Tax=Mesorhizobium sp. B2-3-4 TaxID=2589959 RepID=UPI00112DE9FC|nr:hypothetical protein [Mesorhizobium sp. B2-3-4]TPM41569.1 hypothetical protein FJ967_01150 [Mesorhizobium sp. B2-3-4]